MVFQWIRLRTTKERRSDGAWGAAFASASAAVRAATALVAPGLNAVRTMEERNADDGERSNFASYLNGLRQDV